MWLAQPALSLIMPQQQVAQWAQLLEDKTAVSLLRQRLVTAE